ncbi:hypothetical protein TrCOL_g12125 [Triparma columacea]|uniref:Sulfotransferase n=1 Tax=Triparma columacea TaxID=722753 RepID=A0A9W7G222_9STRA|nr:hypothetical protein TrCOL_g12125 [Triparma columacea]
MILLIQRIEKLTSFNPLEGQTEGFPRNNLRNIVEDQINRRNDSPSVTHGEAKEAKRLQTLMKRLAEFVKREGKLHFIHIGKTGGTYFVDNMPEMKNAPFNGYSIFNHWHNLKLGNLNSDTQGHEKENHRYIFFVRDPVDRWISGFMSRFRVGCPSHCHLGDEEEMQTFHLFPTPNSLAEELGTRFGNEANRKTFHTHRTISYYIKGVDNLRSMIDRVAFVGDFRSMEQDTLFIHESMGMPAHKLSKEKVHAAPQLPKKYTELSMLGRCRLEEFLREDYEITDYLFEKGFIKSRFERLCENDWMKGNDDSTDALLGNDDSTHEFGEEYGDWTTGKSNIKRIDCEAPDACQTVYDHILKGDLYEDADYN